jgi:hypothetical protein
LETISRIAAPPAAAIAAAQAAFAELGLTSSLQEYGAEAARLVGQITDEPDIAVATWLAQARVAGFDCNTATAIARSALPALAGSSGGWGTSACRRTVARAAGSTRARSRRCARCCWRSPPTRG